VSEAKERPVEGMGRSELLAEIFRLRAAQEKEAAQPAAARVHCLETQNLKLRREIEYLDRRNAVLIRSARIYVVEKADDGAEEVCIDDPRVAWKELDHERPAELGGAENYTVTVPKSSELDFDQLSEGAVVVMISLPDKDDEFSLTLRSYKLLN